MEKAHPDVWNILLGVMDDGRLTDSKGRTVSFASECAPARGGWVGGRGEGWRGEGGGAGGASQASALPRPPTRFPSPPHPAPPPPHADTILIMTSNLGANLLLEHGCTPESRALVMEVVRKHFRPEFLNRLDEIVQFDPLAPAQLRSVARLLTGELNERLGDKGITLEMTGESGECVCVWGVGVGGGGEGGGGGVHGKGEEGCVGQGDGERSSGDQRAWLTTLPAHPPTPRPPTPPHPQTRRWTMLCRKATTICMARARCAAGWSTASSPRSPA